MRSLRLLLAFALVAAACSSGPAPQQANDLLFAGDQGTPIVVEPSDPVDETTSEPNTAPPSPLAFADWTTDDLLAQLDSTLNQPITATFDGDGDETLYLSGDNWAVVSEFPSVGQGENQWVTYSQVEAGVLSLQTYSASTIGDDIDALIADDSNTDSVVMQFRADRAVLTETSEFASMWVPYDRDTSGFFTGSVLNPRLLKDILEDVQRGLLIAEQDGTLEIESTEDYVRVETPDLEYSEIKVGADGTVSMASQGGWSLTISPGVDSGVAIGAPDQLDVLSRELLLTATSAPDSCITPVIEASTIVENGLIVCSNLEDLQILTTAAEDANETANQAE